MVSHYTLKKSLFKNKTESSNSSSDSNVASSKDSIKKVVPLKWTQKFDFGRCIVCRDMATGIHYGIRSCEGCKGFYKRSVDKYDTYICNYGSNCMMTPRQRRRCKYCRWKACVAAGMSFDLIKMGRISKVDKEKVKKNVEEDILPDTFTDDFSRIKMHDECNTMVRPEFHLDEESWLHELREKCLEVFQMFSHDMVEDYNRAVECLKTNEPGIPSPDEINPEYLGTLFKFTLKKMSDTMKLIVYQIMNLPGFSRLDIHDLYILFEQNAGTLLGIKYSSSYVGGEVFYLINYGVRIPREVLLRLAGPEVEQRVYNFHERFDKLGLTLQEISILMPTLISYVDKNMQLKNPSLVKRLHEIYRGALKKEFKQQNRSKEYVQELVEVLKLSPVRKEFIKSKPEMQQTVKPQFSAQ